MDRSIPCIHSRGVPFERGLHLGRAARDRVRHSVAAYMVIFRRVAGLSRESVFAQAERFLPVITASAPHLVEEMRGIAEGAGCHFYEIVAINARTELMYGVTNAPECTSVAVGAAASVDGHVRLAQNWDWHPSLAGALVLWSIARDDGPALVTLAEAGIVGKIGMNAAGLAMCVNLLKSDDDFAGPAVPMHILLRLVLEQATNVQEAIDLISTAPRCTSCNHLLADRAGAIADVEATPAGVRALYPQNNILAHSNHCLQSELAAHDRYRRDYPETIRREKRMSALATRQVIDEACLRAMLADHDNAPYSICLHNKAIWAFSEQAESVASIIFDLTARTIDVADGPPCEYEYRRVEHRFAAMEKTA